MPKSIAVEPKSTAFEGSEMWLKHSENAFILILFLPLPTKRRMGRNGKRH